MKRAFGNAALLLFVTLWTVGARAQPPTGRNPRLDSLEVALKTQTRADTNRVKTLNELVWEHRGSNPARSQQLGSEALRLARQLHFRIGEAKTQALLGILHSYAGRNEQARRAFEACIRLRRELGDSVGVAGMINNIGSTYVAQDRYEAAAREFVKALAMEEKYGTPQRVAEDLANLGNVMAMLNRTDQALKYLRQYLAVKNRDQYPPNEAEIRYNLAQLLLQVGQPDSARYYADEARRLSESVDDRRGAGIAHRILAQVMAVTGQLAQAEAHAQTALKLAQQLEDKPDITLAWLTLGRVQHEQRNWKTARASLTIALRMSREANDLRGQQQAVAALAKVSKQTGDFRQALAYQEQASSLQDSLLAAETTRQVTDIQTRYDTDKKDAQNRLQAAQLRTQQQVIRQRNVQLVAGLVIAGLLLGLGYLLYTRRRLRREVEFAQERQQLERLRSQAVLEAEEAERRRIGSDLHDGVGQLLTAAKLNLHALGEQLSIQTAGQQTMLQNALDVVDESFREVRSISHNLMPNALIKRGLAQAVRDFLSKISPDDRLKIQLEVVGLDRGGRLDATVENVLFRVIQELAQNIVKHAQATQMTLQIIRSEDELTIMVEDNGVGFDPAALGAEAGIGLKNIESRMAYLGGRAEFDSSPGRGTTVTLEVPLAAQTVAS
ncbi:tetratricopeptide repeat protein [Hymenobacter sp. ASUV-10]|uniref:Oxygen sensor histidine kinase NreB n=1 Tax=Hymenobacter aranciens TaxID=3063996 RepID=A0ABT9BGY2_9BACT|nr:tetratricopeptide repeat protein [Hymenobacter sp. ASUV-10]MDO7877517.1 tetratricopeptide repeat protein [Hymenobacter sp. ASUV-10]